MTATVTTDFRDEYEAERTKWLRTRFLWYAGVVGGFSAILLVSRTVKFFALPDDAEPLDRYDVLLRMGVAGLQAILYLGAFLSVRRTARSRDALLRLVTRLLIIWGLLALVVGPILVRFAISRVEAQGGDETVTQSIEGVAPGFTIFGVFVAHFLASLFIPWSPKEAAKPLVPLLLAYAVMVLVFLDARLWVRIVFVCLSPLVGVPGVAISWWRHSRFRDRFHYRMLRGRYGEMKRELVDARRIHEALFPDPIHDGAVRFEYRYEPMRQIGGDFLFCHRFPGVDPEDADNEPLSVAIIDVTGHGIPAALTVNRLHGELERLFAEDPDLSPGGVITALNRYVHLTLATHSVYATAICFRVDPETGELEYASAGHPPAFVRTVDGRIERLDSTTFVLGAAHGDDFDANQQSRRFGPGDTLIAYTDGATEARDQTGRMLRVDGFLKAIVNGRPDGGAEGGWAPALLRAITDFRFGPGQDDTLIVEIYRPLRV